MRASSKIAWIKTRRHVKWVDIADGAITLAIGVLAYLLAAAVIDHWLISGGLGFWGRLLLWVGLLGGSGLYFIRRVLPPLMYHVNPIFAAATIEKSEPSLKKQPNQLLAAFVVVVRK